MVDRVEIVRRRSPAGATAACTTVQTEWDCSARSPASTGSHRIGSRRAECRRERARRTALRAGGDARTARRRRPGEGRTRVDRRRAEPTPDHDGPAARTATVGTARLRTVRGDRRRWRRQLAELDRTDDSCSTIECHVRVDRLANQLTEIGNDIEPIHAGAERLAAEQARYQIQFRQDLAELAERSADAPAQPDPPGRLLARAQPSPWNLRQTFGRPRSVSAANLQPPNLRQYSRPTRRHCVCRKPCAGVAVRTRWGPGARRLGRGADRAADRGVDGQSPWRSWTASVMFARASSILAWYVPRSPSASASFGLVERARRPRRATATASSACPGRVVGRRVVGVRRRSSVAGSVPSRCRRRFGRRVDPITDLALEAREQPRQSPRRASVRARHDRCTTRSPTGTRSPCSPSRRLCGTDT